MRGNEIFTRSLWVSIRSNDKIFGHFGGEIISDKNLNSEDDEPKWEKALSGDEAEAWQAAFKDVEVADVVHRGQVR